MPLYEYLCRSCAHEFEVLVRPGNSAPKCTSCGSEDLEKLLSHLAAVSTDSTRSTSFDKARKRAKKANRDKEIAQFEYEEKHRHHH
jgi:putative FmdB family regulatory protein